MMGFGCNVPACLGCRIMETHRERLIAIFVTTLVPCAAVTAVILGLVARFVSIWWAVGLYVTDFAIILILGRIAFRVLPGEPTGLIMEIPTMRIPQFRTTLRQAWFRMRDFVYIAFPIIIVSTVVIKLIEFFGILEPINSVMSPVTVLWLGLPAVTGIAFIFGILRKELTLVMLAALLGTTSFANVLTPVQMLVFAFVTMLYIPCAATIAALVKETGWRRSAFITVFEILFAIIMGGVFLRVLLLFA
jgi:ferrous iron transport protein B